MPTSTLQVFRSQLVAVSAGVLAPKLQGVAVEQNCTLVTGSAAAGPKVAGTARGAVPALGDAVAPALGLAFGEVLALGEALAVGPVVVPPRLARMIAPPAPSNRIRTTAMIAGINQDGRSGGALLGGLRATVGWRAGVGAGARGKAGGGANGTGATGVGAGAGARAMGGLDAVGAAG